MVFHCPDDPFTPLRWHPKALKDLISHLSSNGVMTTGSNPAILIFSNCWLTYVMEEGSPKQIRITVRGTEFYGPPCVLSHIPFPMILRGLFCAGKGSKFRDSSCNTLPPSWPPIYDLSKSLSVRSASSTIISHPILIMS